MIRTFRKLLNSFAFRLSCFTLLAVASTYLLTQKDYFLGGIACAATILLFVLVILANKQYRKKITFLLEAIENNDNAFKFPDTNLPKGDELINRALNQITEILYNAKLETIQQEKYYELIINSITAGIIALDDNGYIHQSNREALHLLKIPALTHVKQLYRIDENLGKEIEHITSGSRKQITFNTEAGTTNLSVHASEIITQDKHLRILVLNDIKKELEEKEIDSWIRLTRVLTHEIMNSITPITSISDTLLSFPEVNEEISKGLEVISTTGKGLISFVESYRQFTHIPQPEPELFYAERFIDRMVKLARHQSTTSDITYKINTKPSDLIIYADENLISQVAINLLKNAIQAIGDRPDGIISITTRCNESEVISMEIANNGPAIPSRVIEHIFIPFFTTKEEGNGIGLSISRQIMRLSGGSLYLKHSSDSEGTAFVLEFK